MLYSFCDNRVAVRDVSTPADFSDEADEALEERLSDREFLRNYCTFAGMHRAITADVLFRSLKQEPHRRRWIGLEMMANFAAVLEDVALWFFVLREWKNNDVPLFDLLDTIRVSEGQRYSAQRAFQELIRWSTDDMRREFGLPSNRHLLSWGWTEDMVKKHVAAITEALDRMKSALGLRIEEQGIVVSGYNKIKHGMLAIATSEHSSIGVSIMLPSRRGARDIPTGKRKINAEWVACEDEELSKLARVTIFINEALWVILCIIYKSRFDYTWAPPKWPVSQSQ